MTTLEQQRELYQSLVTELLKTFPTAHYLEFSFQGSGDSFDSFYSFKLLGENLQLEVDLDNDWVDRIETDLSDLIWKIIDQLGADFNNDGSTGTITFNLKKGTVAASFNWWELAEVPGNSLEDKQLHGFYTKDE